MKLSIIVIVLIAGLTAIATGWIYQSSSSSLTARPALEIPSDIDYFMTNFRYRSIDQNGLLDFQIESQYLEHYTKEDISRIESPVVRAYRQNDDWRVEADSGQMYHRSNTMRLSDNVVMQKMGGDLMEVRSESILFEPDRDLLVSNQGLVIEWPNARISADEGVFDIQKQVYKLKNAKAVYYR